MSIKRNIAIIGAGGFGNEVYHLINNKLYDIVGFIDYEINNINLPLQVIGHESDMGNLVKKFSISDCLIAIGNINKRKTIFYQVKSSLIEFPFITDNSVINFSDNINHGSIIYPNVVIMNGCSIGKFTLLNSGVTLGHDVVIGDYCNINPGAHLAGKIKIGDSSMIGMGAIIKENINIGNNVIVGAGSVVLNDIPDNSTVYGVPAQVIKAK